MSLLDQSRTRSRFFGRRSMHLGEDILLARHGAHIHHLVHDRRNRRMVAVLHDGTVDFASNALLAAAPTPLERLSQQLQDVRNDVAPISKADLKILGWFTAGWAVVSAIFIVGTIALSAATGTQAFAQAATIFPSY
ncbi:hypothetical protein [Sinomonas sp. P47F7]|uniref:hypothetical protein n=1 Tax=Sinomonas sp. P47F7 TaxID=3410987 RepID=UPI003BF5C531